MSLSDFKGNVPGSAVLTGPLQYQYQRSDDPSQNQSYTVDALRATRVRSGNTSSPVSLLPGTSTPWRKPTSFSRAVTWFVPGQCTIDVNYNPNRTDTYVESTWRLTGNDPDLNEMAPVWGYSSSIPDYDYNDYARAITECLLKIGNQKAQYSASLATAHQTVNMVADSAKRLWSALLAAKRGQWGSLPGKLGFGRPRGSPGLAGYWLEYQYGWKPLMDDIYAGMEAFNQLEPEAMIISARRVIRGSNQYERNKAAENGIVARWKTKVNYTTTCELHGRISDSWLRAGSQYGLVNPASLAWELIPWSFLVDWTMPVGNFLEAFTSTAGLDFIGGYTSRWGQGETLIRYDLSGQYYPWNNYKVGNHQVKRFGFRRDALSGWPLPLPYVKSPFSNAHTLNALALLKQLLK